jgi:putative flippase GtrA
VLEALRNKASMDMKWLYESEKLRFIISGILSNAIGFSLYLIFVEFGMHPKTSMSVLYWTSVFFTFFVNRTFVFDSKANPLLAVSKYLSVYLMGYFFSMSFMSFLLDELTLNHVYSIIIANCLMAVYFYLMQKFLVFK